MKMGIAFMEDHFKIVNSNDFLIINLLLCVKIQIVDLINLYFEMNR